MDLFNIILILSIRCTADYFSSNEILMFENNYWKENINQVKTFKGSLEYVILRIVDKKYLFHFSKCLLNNCHYDSYKKKYYFILCPCHSKYIFYKLDKGEQVILRSTYTYSYTTLEKLSKSNRVKKYRYDNFKILIKDNDNIIKLGNDDLIAYQSHIKDFFSRFINSGCIIAENFKSVLEDDFLETTPKFVLYHFDSLSSCLESYKKFMDHCNFLNLVDDNRNLRFKFRTNSNNIFKASKLKKHLDYYFENDFKIKKKI